jgi:glycerate dehydrogenase
MDTLTAVFLDYGTIGPGVDCSALERRAEVQYFDVTAGSAVVSRLQGADIAIVNKILLTSEILTQLPQLKLILVVATGTDIVALEQARQQGIAVYNIRDYCTASVTQHVIGMILALTHDLGGNHRLAVAGEWSRAEHFCMFDSPIRELSGRALGIVGHGTLGSAVGRVAAALGMRVLVAARPGAAPENGRLALAVLLAAADVVSLHCPLTAATQGLIGEPELELLGPQGVLINTARGALVDSAALAAALRGGRLGGAGIDVLEQEPPPDQHPLLDASIPRLIVTPHVAWSALESRQRALQQTAENIDDFLSGAARRRVA